MIVIKNTSRRKGEYKTSEGWQVLLPFQSVQCDEKPLVMSNNLIVYSRPDVSTSDKKVSGRGKSSLTNDKSGGAIFDSESGLDSSSASIQ